MGGTTYTSYFHKELVAAERRMRLVAQFGSWAQYWAEYYAERGDAATSTLFYVKGYELIDAVAYGDGRKVQMPSGSVLIDAMDEWLWGDSSPHAWCYVEEVVS